MKHLALMLMLLAMATTAQAGGDKSSLFTCGVNFGGKQLTYQSSSETKNKKDYRLHDARMNHVMGAVRTEPVRLSLPRLAKPNKSEIRLPPKLTFAIIGCSWR
jgi:hypothetical protein